MSQPFLPPLLNLINTDHLPAFLRENSNVIASFVNSIRYKQLIEEHSAAGSDLFYKLQLATNDKLALDIPGVDGMQLIINPSETSNTTIDTTVIFKLEILKYINGFSISNFSGDPSAIIEILFELCDLDEEELLSKVISVFIGSEDQIDVFVDTYFDKYGIELSLTGLTDQMEMIAAIVSQIEENAQSVILVISEIFINSIQNFSEAINKLGDIFRDELSDFGLDDIWELFIPEINVTLESLRLGLSFPPNILRQVDENNEPILDEDDNPIPGMIEADFGSLIYDSEDGFEFNGQTNIDLPRSEILESGFILSFSDVKFDFSRTSNIPEATADGRPMDFIGVYITEGTIGFPTSWNHDPEDEGNTAELFVNNMLVGTGGISGTIGMRARDPEADPEVTPLLIQAKFGQDFKVGLKGFDITFQQNAIIGSNIHGFLQIPGFKNEDNSPAEIDIDIHIGQDGEFSVVASSDQELKKIKVPGAFEFEIESMFMGREQGDDGRFYLGISGVLDITVDGGIGKFLPDKLDIKKMLIYDDGTFEFEGGKLVLPKAYEIKLGPATLSITGIHMGSHEQDGRKYKYFGFDGGVSTNPGGVDAQGKGLKYYYTVDGEDPFKWFIRLESLTVDIVLPSGTDPDKAAVVIHGFLSISEPKIPNPPPAPDVLERLKNSQEYSGGVSVKLPKFRGLEGSAAMRMNPKFPSFIIDLGIEMKTPILLGATGLGIYGFRALLGKNYVAEKTAAGIPADGEWWQYYKAKIEPDYKEGIQVSKFNNKDGFSLGAGVSLATASDSGKIFSSKLFFMLSLPDVFLFQGQAQFLKERIGLDANPDPPFFAIIAITNQSIEAGFGVNYKLRDNGKLVTVDGIVEMGFFWGNSSAWYVNIGRETPEDRRIQARLFDILNMYFYLMLSKGGMRLGAGVKFELVKKFGPLSAELKAYIDTFGKISRRPRQIGGAIKMGGKVGLKVCGFGFSVSGGATLAAEASTPHIITGEFEVCVTVLKKERCARFEFTWNFDNTLDTSAVPLLVNTAEGTNVPDAADANRVAGMTHMVTKERFPVASKIIINDQLGVSSMIGSIPDPDTWITNEATDDYRVPIDSFLDIDFKKGMNVNSGSLNNLNKLGGISSPANYVEFVPPIRGKSDRVRHEFYLKDIAVAYWDEISESWKAYDFYNSMLPITAGSAGDLEEALDADALLNAKWGYWQQQAPGVNNKLRILATTPLSYAAGTGDAYTIEDLGVNGNTIFCPGDPISETCITFDENNVGNLFPAGTIKNYKDILFRTVSQDGVVAAVTYDTFDQGLFVASGDLLEMYFPEPMWSVRLRVNTASSGVTAKFYKRKDTGVPDSNGLPVFEYDLIDTVVKTGSYGDAILFETPDDGIDLVTLLPGTCGANSTVSTLTANAADIVNDVKDFLKMLIVNHHLNATSVELFEAYYHEYETFFGSSLYPTIPDHSDVVMLTQQHIGPLSLSFSITDTHGYNCNYSFEAVTLPAGFGFQYITDVKSISVYTADDALGNNNNLLVDFDVAIGGVISTARFILTTCHVVSVGYNSCSAALYKMCYLSYANHLLNESVDAESQPAANSAMIEAINGTLQPIWRPNTIFAVSIKTVDQLFTEGNSLALKSYFNHTAFGFRTAGPVGHFHQYQIEGVSETDTVLRNDFEVLDANGKADEFRLKSLKSYIDYSKSYPNADGDLSNSKPLFYNDAELRLFYLYNHVYYFFNNWVDYENPSEQNIATASLDIRVLDPASGDVPAPEDAVQKFNANQINHASGLGLPPSNIHSLNSDVALLNNLLNAGDTCEESGELTPIDISSHMVLNLKPLKLYTAQFVAKYNPRIAGALDATGYEALVHSYVFQTSRYKDFEEQVQSYKLKVDGDDVLKAAIYSIECPVPIDFNLAQNVLTDDLTTSQEPIRNQYADLFDRLVNGVFALDAKTLQVPVSTEFNLVKANGQNIGILVRNPEPFNNPRMPQADPTISSSEDMETLQVAYADGETITGSFEDFFVIHSKDHSQMFITLRDFSFDLSTEEDLYFGFHFKTFNGLTYDDTIEGVTINFNNYLI